MLIKYIMQIFLFFNIIASGRWTFNLSLIFRIVDRDKSRLFRSNFQTVVEQ